MPRRGRGTVCETDRSSASSSCRLQSSFSHLNWRGFRPSLTSFWTCCRLGASGFNKMTRSRSGRFLFSVLVGRRPMADVD